MNLVNLNSVGCFIDTKTGNTYPALSTGGADLTDPVNILDTDKDNILMLIDSDDLRYDHFRNRARVILATHIASGAGGPEKGVSARTIAQHSLQVADSILSMVGADDEAGRVTRPVDRMGA
jgi:hypothetical protein|tara:strand:+ start:528 stop:890 length:363 start_codon:yes stop_codon:yes gene_type:complete